LVGEAVALVGGAGVSVESPSATGASAAGAAFAFASASAMAVAAWVDAAALVVAGVEGAAEDCDESVPFS